MFVEHRLRGVDPEFFKLRSPTQIPPAEPKEISTAEFSEGPIDGGFPSMGVPKNELTSIDNHGVFSTIFPNKNHPFVASPMYLWPPLRCLRTQCGLIILIDAVHLCGKVWISRWMCATRSCCGQDSVSWFGGFGTLGGGVSQFLDVFFSREIHLSMDELGVPLF